MQAQSNDASICCIEKDVSMAAMMNLDAQSGLHVSPITALLGSTQLSRPRPTLAIPHGHDISRRALAILHRNAFHLDNTQADAPGSGLRCVYAEMSLVTRTLEDHRWASSRSLNVAKPANVTRSAQHHYSCGEGSQ
jgi:hypothetical protein